MILGGGGREHALAWAISQNPKCDRLIAAPGNAGIADLAELAALDIMDGGAVAEFALAEAIDFVIIGPEAPLAAGVSDRLRDSGLLVFGPSQAAAMLETSKTFTKQVCDACGAPTARWARFDQQRAADAYVAAQFEADPNRPVVIKADGLAAGKGVVVADHLDMARAALSDMFAGAFGAAGTSVVIEEFMTGDEASLFVLCDGETALPIGTAQDHKRIGDGDTGPNTGGMGAYSPAPVLEGPVAERTMREIVSPCLAEMARRGTPFQGVLYVGLMIADGAPRLVEFNVRFGDPECQVLMMRLGAQIFDLMQACAEGRLADEQIIWADDHAMTIVLASPGYPGAYPKGSVLKGLSQLPENSQTMMFHAGTEIRDGQVVTNGGRVLNATARGATLTEARERAYALVEAVDWPEGVYRRDIGWRAL